MRPRRTLTRAAIVVATLVADAPLLFAADGVYIPDGPEFRVNTHTIGDQLGSGPFTVDGYGDTFVVVWQSEAQDGDQSGIVAQRFSNDGTPLGNEIPVNSYTTGRQFSPAVAMQGDGSFVVVWVSDGAEETDLFARRFDASGVAQGTEFQVNIGPGGVEFHPSVDSVQPDGFVVVREAIEQALSSYDVFGSCTPECICAPHGPLPITAVDALVRLAVALGTPGPALSCPC